VLHRHKSCDSGHLSQKVKEVKERKLLEWDPEVAKSRLAELLFDYNLYLSALPL
jgi:hypothetical protein